MKQMEQRKAWWVGYRAVWILAIIHCVASVFWKGEVLSGFLWYLMQALSLPGCPSSSPAQCVFFSTGLAEAFLRLAL